MTVRDSPLPPSASRLYMRLRRYQADRQVHLHSETWHEAQARTDDPDLSYHRPSPQKTGVIKPALRTLETHGASMGEGGGGRKYQGKAARGGGEGQGRWSVSQGKAVFLGGCSIDAILTSSMVNCTNYVLQCLRHIWIPSAASFPNGTSIDLVSTPYRPSGGARIDPISSVCPAHRSLIP